MNQINPKKLKLSKWTAVNPQNKEKHFIVSKVTFDEENNVSLCVIEAVMSNKESSIDWKTLKNSAHWKQGWV
jgi:tryptophan-rich hypothetical protein